MRRRFQVSAILTAAFAMLGVSAPARAATIAGGMDVLTTNGRRLAMHMTIGEESTTFELSGPDFSWFAFGFDTNTMSGYSLIVTGLDDQRSVVEQNLVTEGDPGMPQDVQNITVVKTVHDQLNDLTTITLVRDNDTGDLEDPVFSTDMTSLDVVWAYSSRSSPEVPHPNVNYHTSDGRGFGRIAFHAVPEPSSAALVAILGTCATARRWFHQGRRVRAIGMLR